LTSEGLGGPKGIAVVWEDVAVQFARDRAIGGWDKMKNTGKRIFFAVVAVALANAVLLASAGLFTSQR
jgi:hypothetical protein